MVSQLATPGRSRNPPERLARMDAESPRSRVDAARVRSLARRRGAHVIVELHDSARRGSCCCSIGSAMHRITPWIALAVFTIGCKKQREESQTGSGAAVATAGAGSTAAGSAEGSAAGSGSAAAGSAEGSAAGSAGSSISIFNKAPHPNAAKVFINWFLSREGQTINQKSVRKQTRRIDVAAEGIDAFETRIQGVKYFPMPDEKEKFILTEATRYRQLAEQLFAPLK